MATKLTRGQQLIQAMKVGGGTLVAKIAYGTVAVAPGTVAGSASAETAINIPGAAAGDIVMMGVPASLEAALAFSGVRVSAAGSAQVRVTNVGTASVVGASRTWEYLWFDLT